MWVLEGVKAGWVFRQKPGHRAADSQAMLSARGGWRVKPVGKVGEMPRG